MSMEHNGENAENTLPSTLCRSGCGFYASAAFEGMCSKCYKDSVKRRQQNSSPTPTCLGGRNSPSGEDNWSLLSEVSSASTASTTPSTTASSTRTDTVPTRTSTVDTSKRSDVDTATPTVSSTTITSEKDSETSSQDNKAEGAVACTSSSDSASDRDKKPKKNRCHSCKKKVGLTGFPCRCGSLFCGMHRYSDKHDCSFNYKELGQQQIRKANPVVVGQKIQKI